MAMPDFRNFGDADLKDSEERIRDELMRRESERNRHLRENAVPVKVMLARLRARIDAAR